VTTNIAAPKGINMTTQIQMYSRYEAAAMLGISFVTLDRLTKDGRIKTTNIGRRVLFAGNDLLSFIRAQKKATR
jgi:excisionase family DNA binding protein